MEHANKAFMMAAGMLFALMILGLVAFVFSSLAPLPTEEDIRLEAKQVAAFNNEFTAYDKKIMYGTDLISVLNKAKNNNEKYVRGDYVTGGGYTTDFLIDIEVKLKSPLIEHLTVYYIGMPTTGNGIFKEYAYSNNAGPSGVTVNDAFRNFTPSNDYRSIIYQGSDFWNGNLISNENIKTKVEADTYHILGTSAHPLSSEPVTPNSRPYTMEMVPKENKTNLISNNHGNMLYYLLMYSTEMERTVKNTGDNTGFNGWSKAIWKPAIYDLKTKKFKSNGDQIVISSRTGRIIKMVFEEI